jgi:hypothetical protein
MRERLHARWDRASSRLSGLLRYDSHPSLTGLGAAAAACDAACDDAAAAAAAAAGAADGPAAGGGGGGRHGEGWLLGDSLVKWARAGRSGAGRPGFLAWERRARATKRPPCAPRSRPPTHARARPPPLGCAAGQRS